MHPCNGLGKDASSKNLVCISFFSILLLLASTLQLYFWRIHSLCHVPLPVMNLLIGLWIFRCVETPENMIGKILNSRLLSAIGVLSYSLYVWQEMFLIYSPGTKTVIPWNLMATLGVAVVSYNVVERPFLRLKSRFAQSDPHTAKLKTIPAAASHDKIGDGPERDGSIR